MSLRELAARVPCDPGLLSKLENGKRPPSEKITTRLDALLGCRGHLIAAGRFDVAAAQDSSPGATSELLQRIQASDTTPQTLESLHTAVIELCCAYSTAPALELRAEAHGWLKRVGSLLRQPIGLAAHRELLVSAGWLALLTGCTEYDAGMGASAHATRLTAEQIGTEAGHPELVGWAHEMSAWFHLTGGRYRQALDAATKGLQVAGKSSVGVQLEMHRAKALARLGDAEGVSSALDAGRAHLDSLPFPDRPDHHFVVDPDKWDIYATDAYRMVGADALAETHARAVIKASTGPDGRVKQPMRISEAKLTLAAVAVRRGELEEAVSHAVDGLSLPRRSLPSLVLVAGEVESELSERYPNEPATERFRETVRGLRA
jgi:hypothetical protein